MRHDFLRTKVVQNASWIIAGKVYQIAVNLVVSMLSARYLGPSNYGLINYAASFTALFTTISDLGTNGIIVHELLNKPEKQGRILGTTIVLRLISSGLSIVTICLLALFLNPGERHTQYVILVYSTTLMIQSFQSIRYWYQSRMLSKVSTIIASVGYTATSIYKIVLLVSGLSVEWFAAAHAVEYGVEAVLLLAAYYKDRDQDQGFAFCMQTGKELLKKSVPFIPSGIMVALYGQMDKVMLRQSLSDTAVGYYSAAVAISSMWAFILSAIIDSSKPGIFKKYKERDEHEYRKQLIVLYGILIYLSIAAAVGISVLSKFIVLALYGEAYMGAQPVLCIVVWSTLFSYLGVARSIWMVPNGKQKYEKYIAASGAVCNLILNAVMIPVWGVNGAAIATLVTQIFTNFIVGFFFKEIRENNILILKAFRFWRYLK